MKKCALILALFTGIGIANAVESNHSGDILFDPEHMSTPQEDNDLAAALNKGQAGQVLLEKMIDQGRSLEVAVMDLMNAAPDRVSDIITAAIGIAPNRAGAITQVAILKSPDKAAVIEAAAIKAAPGQKAQIVNAAHAVSGSATPHQNENDARLM